MSTASLFRPSAPPHPVGLRLHGRRVVVVGGGTGSYRATVGLLDAGALVTVVSPDVVPALEALAGSGSLSWTPRRYAPGDLDGAWFAVAATADAAVDEVVAADAERARVFCTRADDPGASSACPALPDAEDGLLREGARGRVVLVGGGPGDPGLITVRGRQALSQADVVVVDHLGPRSLLAGLRGDVEIVDASKLPRGRSMPQEQINALLVSHARAGKEVVRLKGGDPFVFGRGMEELLACAAADVPVEVVPGVTSAIGVPGVAGIPVTHRGLTHEFVVVSGHLPPGHPQSLVDWSAIGRLRGTVVVLMGVETAPAIAAALIRHGRRPDAPVAVVVEGTTGSERTVRTTLADLGATLIEESVRPPAVWVVGDVVQLAAEAAPPPSLGFGPRHAPQE
ncbi:uroporphyrinogen-III C-methyltransferase [Blastococcus sp. CT_GayMR20]|uniref:uroporphyrinogen-III C-methyltransferase n=1 Tax=Blastococcus sp. CT_GayMR20 TaxID=2559609 RepID=UPI0010737AE9|nr:uroporphyrinogen-III C-methyltransferase [Blastococcus sp. CT_GayMR20]TFV70829.1 uroporphyrinogen-III C-methyltransferase [Blastococcus sp. CT_GayMR20]TFV70834.1 uroporphyrinogen-III C-methyltransferase [Blastococcus sp. CT_GayMR20]